MGNQKKVGILGGTFDPIHTAHLILAEAAYEQFELDTVLIMPSGDPPHKTDREITPSNHRIKMVQLAIEDNKHFKLSTIEVERNGKTYTAETLTQLVKYNPDCRYYFIIGADSLFGIEEWRHPEIIMHSAVLLAAVREQAGMEAMKEQIEHLKAEYQAEIYLLHTSDIEISSSAVRDKVACGESIRYYVPKDVEKYIYNNHLYR